MSNAPHAPARRGIVDLPIRVERLHAYEAWRPIVPVPFEEIVGAEAYTEYWKKLDGVVNLLGQCQVTANQLRQQIATVHGAGARVPGEGASDAEVAAN